MNYFFPAGYDLLHWAGVVFSACLLWKLSGLLIDILGDAIGSARKK